MSPLDLLICAVVVIVAGSVVVWGLGLWPRRRSLRSAVPTSTTQRTIPTADEARKWRLQAIEDEHAYWDERFRAAGGIPPLRKAERERLLTTSAGFFGGFYAGSNTRVYGGAFGYADRMVAEQAQATIEAVRRSLIYDPTPPAPSKPPRKEWRTPLRDLVDPPP